jgi:hypothetical protein
LSDDVDAALLLPNVSVTEFAAMDGITVPDAPTAVADRAHVILSVVDKLHVTPVAVPFCTMSEVVKLDAPTALENVAVKLIGATLTGSA